MGQWQQRSASNPAAGSTRPPCQPSRPLPATPPAPACPCPCSCPISYRRRYGLIGPNGCGKSCLLKALGARDLDIPEHIDVFLLDREIAASDMTALEAVKSVDAERARLEAEAERLADQTGDDVEARLEDIYER